MRSFNSYQYGFQSFIHHIFMCLQNEQGFVDKSPLPLLLLLSHFHKNIMFNKDIVLGVKNNYLLFLKSVKAY